LFLQELGRRLKATNPVVAEIFTLMSRDEARHAGFLNKAMSDFNLVRGFICVLAAQQQTGWLCDAVLLMDQYPQ
jgi:hypothetical protein